ncbi:hypothetical protein [Devosia marina]|uniref:Uncharacterized protein n=1 Tax=Devosia marina TaxID=2683198 RepID=A0A7X3K3T8_9HYPH|nr:hypothetical protein [Devosia marina]MVS99248.1 hypothetical protein [Devosia marina]
MAMTLEDFKRQNPAYAQTPDDQLADGLYRKFYADKMDRADFDAMVQFQPSPQARYDTALGKVRQSQFPDMSDEQWQDYSGKFFAPDMQAQGQQSTTLGFGDEISAAMGGLGAQARQWTGGGGGGFGEAYGDLYELEQARLELARQNNGAAGTALEVAGGLATMGPARSAAGALLAPAATTGGPLRQIAQAAPSAMSAGGVYGFGSTDGDIGQRAIGAGVGAGIGAAGAMAVPIAGKLIQGTARKIAQIPINQANKAALSQAVTNAPSAASIKAGSKAAYKAAEQTGATIGQPAMQILAHDIDQLARLQGLVMPSGKLSTAYPKVAHAIRSIREYAQGPVSIEQAQTLLRSLRTAQKSIDPDEARLGSMLVDQFETFLDNLPPNAFSANGQKSGQAIQQWAKGRSEWARSKKVSTVENIIADARLKRGDYAQNLRNGFGAILKSNAAKKRRGFTAAELQAIERFVQGGPIEELLQRLGSGSGIPGGLLGGLTGGWAGAMAVPAIGMGARAISRRGAQRGADLLRAQVATPGGLPPMRQLPAPTPMPRVGAPASVGANVLAGEPLRIVVNGAGSYRG